MNGKIDEVIAEDLDPVELIVQGKCEIAYIPGFQTVINRKSLRQRRFLEVGEVFDDRVLYNEIGLVPLKRALKGVGIGEEADDGDDQEMKYRIEEDPFSSPMRRRRPMLRLSLSRVCNHRLI